MPATEMPVLDVLVKAHEESNGETIDTVTEHDLRGVTTEILRWWSSTPKDTAIYRMWCPEDHVSYVLEGTSSMYPNAGSIIRAEEKMGEFPASVLRIRKENLESLPITNTPGYHSAKLTCILGPGDVPVAWIRAEYREGPNGIEVRKLFRIPARTPQKFIKALRKHSMTEMGHLAEILPGLYRQRQRETSKPR